MNQEDESSYILNTAENLFDRCGKNEKYFWHIFRLVKKKSNFILHYLHRDQNVLFQHLRPSDKLADIDYDTWYAKFSGLVFFKNGQFYRERQNFLFG